MLDIHALSEILSMKTHFDQELLLSLHFMFLLHIYSLSTEVF